MEASDTAGTARAMDRREDGRVATTSLVLVWVVHRPSLIPWHQAAEGFGPPPPSRCLSPRRPVPYPPPLEGQKTYGRPVCPAAGIRACRACRPVGRPQDRGNRFHSGRSPPALPVIRFMSPGSRESDGASIARAESTW